MTSETKVPMPKPPKMHPLLFGSDRKWTDADVVGYGDARASERDAYWMAKVEEAVRALEAAKRWNDRLLDSPKSRGDTLLELIDSALASLTNPRAGETA